MLEIAKHQLVSRGGLNTAAAKKWQYFRFPYAAVGFVCAAVDGLIITASSVLGCSAYEVLSNSYVAHFDAFAFAGNVAAVLYLWMAHAAGFYRVTTIFSSQTIYRKIVSRWIFVGLLLALLAFLLKVGEIFSRGSIVSFLLLALVLLLTWRWLAGRIFNSALADGLVEGRRVVLVGSRDELTALDDESLLKDFGLTELDRVIFPNHKLLSSQLGSDEMDALNRALETARQKGADEIVLALSWSNSTRLELVRDMMRSSPLPVQLLPDGIVRTLAKNSAFSVKPSLAIELQRGPLSRLERAAKRALDILGASVGLLVLLPPMLISALVVKMDSPGPILFRQRRNGFNAKQFTIYKFRTMTVIEDDDKIVQASRFDKRVTRVGRILRQSSLDELPQLFNVLKGEMSLVGPRPHAISHDSKYANC